MPTPVPLLPPPGSLGSLVVGAPASATHAAAIAGAAAFLHGRAVHPVASFGFFPTVTPPAKYFFAYCRSPGVESLRLLAEHQRGANADSRGTLALSLAFGSGSVGWLAGSGGVALDGGMDGATPLLATSDALADYPVCEGFVDVSGLTVGSTAVLELEAADYAASGSRGLYSLHASPVPLPVLDPVGAPTAEPGVDAAWTLAGNALVDGSASSPRGVGRLLQQLDWARTKARRHWQIATPTALPWTRNALTMGALTWTSLMGGNAPAWRARAQRFRVTSSPQVVRFGAVYRYSPTYSGLTNSLLRMNATTIGLGGATSANTDLPLTDTAGAWAHGSVLGTWPCDGTQQELELSFGAQTSNTDGVSTTSDLLEVALIYVIAEES